MLHLFADFRVATHKLSQIQIRLKCTKTADFQIQMDGDTIPGPTYQASNTAPFVPFQAERAPRGHQDVFVLLLSIF